MVYSKKKLVLFYRNEWKEIGIDSTIRVFKIIANDGEFYIGTSNGIYILNKHLNLKQLSSLLPKEEIFTLALEKKKDTNIIWFAGKGYIGKYDFKKFEILVKSEQIDYGIADINTILIPEYFDNLIFGNLSKILLINKNNRRVTLLGVNNGLPENSAYDIFIDREQNIWIANDRGATKIPRFRFVHYDKSQGLLENEVTSIVQVGDTHFFGHNIGITVALPDGKKIHLKFENPTAMSRVMDMEVSPFGEVFVAGADQGLLKITNDFKLQKISTPTQKNLIQSLIFDKNGTLYISSPFEIFAKQLNESNFKLIYKTDVHIRKLFIDEENNLWATSVTGGVLKFTRNQINTYKSDNILANSTIGLNFDLQDTILVGTQKGIYYISQNKLKPYWLKIERPIYFIKKYFNYFWFGTDAGVYRWDGRHLAHFATKQGLSGLETNRDACYLDKEGILWIGTNRGLTRYNYNFDYKDVPKPNVFLRRIIYNSTQSIQLWDIIDKINFPSNAQNITFLYDILSFIDENNNQIQYKLEGFDADWSEFKKNLNFDILYRRLPPGEYRLKVRAKNAIGIISDEISSPLLIIEKPFYLSWIFILSVLLVFIVIIFLIIKFVSNWQYRTKLEEEIKIRTRQLAESEARYKQMFMDNNAYMIFYDANTGVINEINPSAMKYFGISQDDIGRLTIFNLLSESIENQSEFLKFLVEQKEYECKYKIANEEVRDGIIHQSRINLNNKCFIYAIIEDVTDRKTAEAKLNNLNAELELLVKQRTAELEKALSELRVEMHIREKTEKELFESNQKLLQALEKEKELGELKSRFISMISHEFRTPLTVILSSAYLIKESLKRGLEEEVDKHLHKIHSSVTTMSRLLEDVLTYGKAEEGILPVRFTDFSLREFLLDIIEEASITDQKQHNILLDIPDGDCRVNTDRYLLRQIVFNILNNSIKYSDKGSNIYVACNSDKKTINISIRDEGKGITDEELDSIFEPFYRNKSTIGITPGIGIGLAIAKRCVQLLNGKIEVNNKLDKGVQFNVIIPINQNI